MSRDIAKVDPKEIVWKVSRDLLSEPFNHEQMRTLARRPFEQTDKCVSLMMRYVEGKPWEETPLFTDIYERRFKNGESVRSCSTPEQLLSQYYTRMDDLYERMRAHGFVLESKPVPVYIGHDDEVLIGDQGNHRLAIAKALGLRSMMVKVCGRHPDSTRRLDAAKELPKLHPSVQLIPAMTTDAERLCYYRLTKAQVHHGAIVELGAWLGASTAYIAAGIRDSGIRSLVHVYDRFVWKPSSHNRKAGGLVPVSQLDAFTKHLGNLMRYVKVHQGELSRLKWKDGDVSLLICDAPKRIPEISTVLDAFAGMKAGAVLVWQDFAYFPSYDIPAAMLRLQDHVEFLEAVYPGTTAVFRVTKPWTGKDVSFKALALNTWTAAEIESAWDEWSKKLPAPMRPRFLCGAAMFLCDIGETEKAVRRLSSILERDPSEVLPKWRYLITERKHLMERYTPLVKVIQRWT